RWKRYAGNWSIGLPDEPVIFAKPYDLRPDSMDQNEIEFEWAGETIRHIGTVVHRSIQHVAQEGNEYRDPGRIRSLRPWYAAQLRQLGVKTQDIEPAVDDVAGALTAMLEDQRGQWILSTDHADARNEYGVTGVINNRLVRIRIDRTFIDSDGIRWIIDYKTSRHQAADQETFLDREQERYHDQLHQYAEIMHGMDERPVKLGLYFPLLQGWRSWDA
ncbi:MAG: PD-(D/E)XK nuclease family protein, partial [Thiotrichales bacterium]|nr:PD-(D/E)XK nuclease family protein [Thiotrichales bacterium]